MLILAILAQLAIWYHFSTDTFSNQKVAWLNSEVIKVLFFIKVVNVHVVCILQIYKNDTSIQELSESMNICFKTVIIYHRNSVYLFMVRRTKKVNVGY